MRKFCSWSAASILCLGLAACQHDSASTDISPPSLSPPVVQKDARPQPRNTNPTPANPGPYAAGPHGWAPSATPTQWRWIVIHHSDTAKGSAASFDRYHREVRHWEELGYHFVIDNGNGGPDGLVEVGPRWRKQKIGAHAGVRLYNEYGIGICLVGDFNSTHPTPAQMRSLTQLTAYLMRHYHIPPANVIGHRDAKGSTQCPGRNMNVASVRRAASTVAGLDPTAGPGAEYLASIPALEAAQHATED